MIRTQVYFSAEQHQALRRAAEREGVSMTALLRRLVDREVVSRTARARSRKEAMRAFVGLGSAGPDDVSEKHDEALDEAFRE
jgi:hypothetical protein